MASESILPDEPVLHAVFTSLSIDDIPELDLQVKGELGAKEGGLLPLITERTEASEEERDYTTTSQGEKPLLCRNVLARDQLSTSPDSIATEYAATSGSEPEFTSDSDFWTDDEDDDTTNESVLCLTSRGARFLDSTDTLRPPLPRRLSFKPLESVTPHLGSPPKLPSPELIPTPAADGPLTPSPDGPSPGIVIFHNDYFAVAQSRIAGWGAFAARDLKYGDRILVERPLLVADTNSLFKEFERLSPWQREVALGLHANSSVKPGTPRLQAVWMANCFSIGIGDKAGLFPIASRFNHSCRPKDNIEYTFNPDNETLEMVVKADTIPAGEELTISYGTRRTPIDLYYRFGFKCCCGACPGLKKGETDSIW
ncbi:hypothetical protein FALCPG4_000480 [Fusarium falciforme]